MKIRLFIVSVFVAMSASVYADYAKNTECVLPTDKGLDYTGAGDLACDKEYGGCSDPWDKYATCFWGYEAVDSIQISAGGGGGVYCTNYGPSLYIYAGPSPDNLTEVLNQYMGANHDTHTYTYTNIPANYRYFKIRFKRPGSLACGSGYFKYCHARRTNSFQLESSNDQKIDDNASVNVTTNKETTFKVNLFSVKHLPSNEPVFLYLADADEKHGSDYIRIENQVFTSLNSDTSRSGCYNLNASKTTFRVKFAQSGTYKVYFEIRSGKDLTIQRRYVTFQVSDNK